MHKDGKMICHHCEEEIDSSELRVAMTLRQGKTGFVPWAKCVYFHLSCFQEIAGCDYAESLVETIDKTEEVPEPNDCGSLNCTNYAEEGLYCTACAQEYWDRML